MKHIAFTVRAILALSVTLLAAPAAAQTADEQAAYVALIYTPVGGMAPLPPILTDASNRAGSAVALQGRIGHFTRRGGLSATALGVGVEMPHREWTLNGTLAYLSASCGPLWAGDPDCSGDIMIGGSARRTLSVRPLGEEAPPAKGAKRPAKAPARNTLVVGFDGSAGYSPRQGAQAMAVAAGLPTAIVIESGDTKIVPFLAPALGYGRLGRVAYFDDGVYRSHGAIAFMIGGGVGFEFGSSGLVGNVGFQKVLKSDGGATAFGLGMTWRGLTATR